VCCPRPGLEFQWRPANAKPTITPVAHVGPIGCYHAYNTTNLCYAIQGGSAVVDSLLYQPQTSITSVLLRTHSKRCRSIYHAPAPLPVMSNLLRLY
jgi:hypothetical protein